MILYSVLLRSQEEDMCFITNILKTKQIKKNIIQPEIDLFKHLYTKSLEEFDLQDNLLDFIKLYYVFKKSKLKYRLSIDLFNLLFSRFISNKSQLSAYN